MSEPLRLLLLDDEPDDRWLVRRVLAHEFGELDVEEPTDAEALARALEGRERDLVITERRLRWTNGLDVLRASKSRWPNCATIMFTGAGTEELAVEAVRTGVDDYVVKTRDHFARLPAAARMALERARTRRAVGTLRETERQLWAAREQYRAVVEASPLAVMGFDREGKITVWNAAAENLFGYRADEVLGRFPPFVRGEAVAEFRELHGRLLAGEIWRDREVTRHRRDGSPIHLRVSSAALVDEDGEVMGMVSVADDVGERKALEEQLHRSRRLEAIGRLAGGIAHDFNNLLTAVTGYTEIIHSKLPRDHELQAAVAEVAAAGARAAELTRQLLAFARRQVLHPEPLDLNHVVRDVATLLRRLIGGHVELTFSLDSELRPVLVDRAQLEQIIINLALNARDAMPEGGTLRVETAAADVRADRVARLEPGDYAVVTVTDSGHGMDADTTERVFEPFFTTKEPDKGTGLGLSTVEGIVAQSGGAVTVESSPGQGTTMRVYLPTAPPTADSVADLAPAAASDEPVPSGAPVVGATVLAVEDEEIVRTLVREILERAGHRVLAVGDAEAAIGLVRAGEAIDLLLTDVMLPGMRGPQLVGEVRKLRPGLPALLMTGYTEAQLGRAAALEPGVRFITKPFTPLELEQAVQALLRG